MSIQYNQLGDSDLKVSNICLGTMTFGQQNTEKEGHQQLDYAIDQGINFFDTAEMYPVPPRETTLIPRKLLLVIGLKTKRAIRLF